MVKPEFSDLGIDFWVHRAKRGGSQPSLCLFHDSPELGSPMLDALIELKNETWPAQRTLTFAACSRERALVGLRLKAVPRREELQVMNIRHNSDVATIEATELGVDLLINACRAWLAGAEDFGVSPHQGNLTPKFLGKLDRESGELWFWGPHYTGP